MIICCSSKHGVGVRSGDIMLSKSTELTVSFRALNNFYTCLELLTMSSRREQSSWSAQARETSMHRPLIVETPVLILTE